MASAAGLDVRQPAGPLPAPVALMTSLRLHLLATPALLPGDAARSNLERKDAALLALLAVDGPLPRSRAAALLWPDADAPSARNNLRQRLFRLRRAAGSGVVDGEDTLQLADGIVHDVGELEPSLAHDPFAAAGELLGGHDYADCDELDEWVQRARAAFRSRRHDILAAAAAHEERQGHVARALLYAERLASDDPLSEQGHRLLMRLHYRRGDRASALAAHARCVEILRRELGTAPGAETRELAALVERSDPLPGTASCPPRTAIARPPRLVGRAREWRAIEHACARGRAVLLTGDAGMGKSRLLGDVARSRRAVLVAARPGDDRVPYALLARLLRAVLVSVAPGGHPGGVAAALMLPTAQGSPAAVAAAFMPAAEGSSAGVAAALVPELARVLPELGAAPAGPMQEARFRGAVLQALEACRAHGLRAIALDDLHYADAASLEILPALATARIELLLATRAAELPDAVAAWARDERGSALAEVSLPSLTEGEVRELIGTLELPGIDAEKLAGPLARHTGGNPYFVLETLGALIAEVQPADASLPLAPTVAALIERRLSQLSPAALRLARVAALAGSDFSATLAARVLDAHPVDLTDAWTEATQASVLAAEGFVHDLVRDVAAGAIPGPIARLLHEAIARHLDAAQVPPARVAHHHAQAGRWAEAGTMHRCAAEHAQRASRRGEEAEQRELAIACFERAGDAASAFEARRDAVEGLILVRGVAHAQGVIDTMLAGATSDAQRAAALVARAKAALMAADHAHGVASAREALALATRIDAPWTRFDAARMLAVGLAQQGAADEAEAIIVPFGALVEAKGSAEQRGGYWADLAYVLNSARHLSRTADALARAIECARELGDLAELATLTSNLATVHGNLGRVDRAYEHACRGRALQVELGDTTGPPTGVIAGHVGLYASALGQYATALAAFDDALACHRRGGQSLWIAVCSNNLAATLVELGQYGRARKALDYATPSVSHVAARGAMLAARIDRLLGSSPAAHLAHAATAMTAGGDAYMSALIELECTESMPAAEAIVACDAVADAADAREYGGVATKARLLAARAALGSGQPRVALARWREIDPLLATVQPTDLYAPAAGAIGREILLANGKHDEAARVLERALRWVQVSALPQVPESFRDSFLRRNPVNRALLAAGRGLGIRHAP